MTEEKIISKDGEPYAPYKDIEYDLHDKRADDLYDEDEILFIGSTYPSQLKYKRYFGSYREYI